MNQHNQVMSFEMHGVQIYGNVNYNDVQMSMGTLNINITKTNQ